MVYPIFTKEGGDITVSVLLRLYSLSFEQAKIPVIQESSCNTNSQKEYKSHSPIPLLSVISKIFVKQTIFKYVYNFVKNNFILSLIQSGFQKGKSTVTQILEIYNKCCQSVDENKEIGVVFIDISKVFDKFCTAV